MNRDLPGDKLVDKLVNDHSGAPPRKFIGEDRFKELVARVQELELQVSSLEGQLRAVYERFRAGPPRFR